MSHSPASHTEPLRHGKCWRKLKIWKRHLYLCNVSGDMSLNTAQKHWPSALRHGHLERNPTPITYPPLPDINDHDPYTPLSQHRVSVSMLQRLQLACSGLPCLEGGPGRTQLTVFIQPTGDKVRVQYGHSKPRSPTST